MTISSKAHRYVALDAYRFIAATGIVVYHYAPDFLGSQRYVPLVERLSYFVDFFFMLSGFVIAVSYMERLASFTDYARFLGARLARLYPLHLATLCLSLTFVAVGVALKMPVNHPEIVAMSGLPSNVLLLHGWGVLNHTSFNVPSWSISAEWFLYLIAPLLFLIARNVAMPVKLLLVALVIVLLRWMDSGDWMRATYDFGMLRAVPTFFIGILIAQWVPTTSMRWSPSWWTVHGIFLLVLCVLRSSLPPEAIIPMFALLITAVALVDRGGAPSIMKGRLLETLGQSSYALYMLHVLASVPVLLALRRLHLLETGWALATACGLYGCVVVLSVASYRYFETPAREWLMGMRPMAPSRLSLSRRHADGGETSWGDTALPTLKRMRDA